MQRTRLLSKALVGVLTVVLVAASTSLANDRVGELEPSERLTERALDFDKLEAYLKLGLVQDAACIAACQAALDAALDAAAQARTLAYGKCQNTYVARSTICGNNRRADRKICTNVAAAATIGASALAVLSAVGSGPFALLSGLAILAAYDAALITIVAAMEFCLSSANTLYDTCILNAGARRVACRDNADLDFNDAVRRAREAYDACVARCEH